MNRMSMPMVMSIKPPTFANPRLLNKSPHIILSLSFGSGLCK